MQSATLIPNKRSRGRRQQLRSTPVSAIRAMSPDRGSRRQMVPAGKLPEQMRRQHPPARRMLGHSAGPGRASRPPGSTPRPKRRSGASSQAGPYQPIGGHVSHQGSHQASTGDTGSNCVTPSARPLRSTGTAVRDIPASGSPGNAPAEDNEGKATAAASVGNGATICSQLPARCSAQRGHSSQ